MLAHQLLVPVFRIEQPLLKVKFIHQTMKCCWTIKLPKRASASIFTLVQVHKSLLVTIILSATCWCVLKRIPSCLSLLQGAMPQMPWTSLSAKPKL